MFTPQSFRNLQACTKLFFCYFTPGVTQKHGRIEEGEPSTICLGDLGDVAFLEEQGAFCKNPILKEKMIQQKFATFRGRVPEKIRNAAIGNRVISLGRIHCVELRHPLTSIDIHWHLSIIIFPETVLATHNIIDPWIHVSPSYVAGVVKARRALVQVTIKIHRYIYVHLRISICTLQIFVYPLHPIYLHQNFQDPPLGWLQRSWGTHWASMGTSAKQSHHHSTFLNQNRCFGESDYDFVCSCKHCQHCHVFLKAKLGVSRIQTWSTLNTASTQRFLSFLSHFTALVANPHLELVRNIARSHVDISATYHENP